MKTISLRSSRFQLLHPPAALSWLHDCPLIAQVAGGVHPYAKSAEKEWKGLTPPAALLSLIFNVFQISQIHYNYFLPC